MVHFERGQYYPIDDTMCSCLLLGYELSLMLVKAQIYHLQNGSIPVVSFLHLLAAMEKLVITHYLVTYRENSTNAFFPHFFVSFKMSCFPTIFQCQPVVHCFSLLFFFFIIFNILKLYSLISLHAALFLSDFTICAAEVSTPFQF